MRVMRLLMAFCCGGGTLFLLLLLAGCSPSRLKRPAVLPTGMSITPTAAPGTIILPLNPDLPEMPDYTADHPIATALSPDGKTLLVLTSGFNRIYDAKGKSIPAFSKEYVFVYDVTARVPIKRQVLQLPNTYMGIAWSLNGQNFYVSGGSDDNIHFFERKNGRWQEALPPLALGHKFGLGIYSGDDEKVKGNKPVAAGLGVSPDGSRLLVANYMNDSVSVVDIAARKVTAELDLRPGKNDPVQKGVAGGEYPYAAVFCGNHKAYISSLRDREIVVLDLSNGLRIT